MPGWPIEVVDTDVFGGNEYCYFVTQVDGGTESDPSNSACATPGGDGVDFLPPENLSADVDGNEVTLQWTEPDIEGGDLIYDIADFEYGSTGEFAEIPDPWSIGNADTASSEYMIFPDNGSYFLYLNDDALGDGADSTGSIYVFSNTCIP